MDTIMSLLLAMVAIAAASPIDSLSGGSYNSGCERDDLIYSDIDGRCHKLTTQGPCQDDSWFVLSSSGSPTCSPRPCSENYALYNGTCTHKFSHACPLLGEALLHNIFGNARCGCKDGWGKHRGECRQEFTKGKCTGGKVLMTDDSVKDRQKRSTFFYESQISSIKKLVSSSTLNLKCVRNPCGDSTEKLLWTDGLCHKVENKDLDNCEVELRGQYLVCAPTVVPFSIAPVFDPRRKKCRSGRVWNKYRRRCVRQFRG